jgi:four helix bundle protein
MPGAISVGMAQPRRELPERAFQLAAKVFKLFPQLAASGPEFAYLAKQLVRAVTSIGANLEEGIAASSRKDMASKYSIALRESRESNWSRLGSSDDRWKPRLSFVTTETNEFVAMLTAAVKKLRQPAQPPASLRSRGSRTFSKSKRVQRLGTKRRTPASRRRANLSSSTSKYLLLTSDF